MPKARVSLELSKEALAKADALATLTGQSRTKAVSEALEMLEPREAAKAIFARRIQTVDGAPA